MTYSAKTDWIYDDLVTEQDLNRIEGGIANLHSRLDEESREEITLKPGMQVVTAKQNASFSLGSIKGRTLVNLLGRAGGFPDLHSIFSIGNHSAALDENNKTVGVHGLKVTSTGAGDGSPGNLIRIGNDTFEDGGSYIILMDARADTSMRLHAELWGNKGDVIYKDINTSWQTLVYRCKGSSGGKGFYVWNASPKAATFYLSAVRIYKVSDDDYLDSDSNLIDKYPYVDSIQPVRNPYAIRYGENLLPPFYEWTRIHPNAKITGPYSMTHIKTASIAESSTAPVIPVLPNTYYYLKNGSYGVTLKVYFSYDGGTFSPDGSLDISDGTFKTPFDCNYILVEAFISEDQTGTFTYNNVMLNIGSISQPFKPYEDAILAFQTDLYADSITSESADEIFQTDGQFYKFTKWRKMVIDEALNWFCMSNHTGYKKVYTVLPDKGILDSETVTKFDGCILQSNQYLSERDQSAIDSRDNHTLYLTISNLDSGWGDDYEPTTDEIRAYFMGWKMFDFTLQNSDGNSLYNGSVESNKRWTPLNSFDGKRYWGVWTGEFRVPTLPPSTLNAGYTKNREISPYQIVYKMLCPVIEPVVSEGQVTLLEGTNHVVIGTGIVLREKAKPFVYPGATKYAINNGVSGWDSSILNNKVLRFYRVYKNSYVDYGWTEYPVGITSAGALLEKSVNEYDRTAVYSITYFMLMSSPATEFSGTYATNEKTVTQDLVEKIKENTTRLSVIENTKPDKEAPTWITPTLLNGWTHYNPSNDTYPPTRFSKDSLGYVHIDGMIAGGIDMPGVTLFKLPVGYRPKNAISFPTVCSDVVEETRIGRIRINPDGIVALARSGGNLYLSTAIPPFLAEQ